MWTLDTGDPPCPCLRSHIPTLSLTYTLCGRWIQVTPLGPVLLYTPLTSNIPPLLFWLIHTGTRPNQESIGVATFDHLSPLPHPVSIAILASDRSRSIGGGVHARGHHHKIRLHRSVVVRICVDGGHERARNDRKTTPFFAVRFS